MRQHVNPLSSNFHEIEIIPPLNEIFYNPNLPLHIDVGSASGDFLFDIAISNKKSPDAEPTSICKGKLGL